jgi:hypothetical protein
VPKRSKVNILARLYTRVILQVENKSCCVGALSLFRVSISGELMGVVRVRAGTVGRSKEFLVSHVSKSQPAVSLASTRVYHPI